MSLEKPRFRRDLEAVPMEAGGERYVEVRDVAKGSSFCFYDFEYRVALAFDGLVLDRVIPWVKMSTGLELQVDQLREFAARLEEMGFLETEPSPDPSPDTPGLLSMPEIAAPILDFTGGNSSGSPLDDGMAKKETAASDDQPPAPDDVVAEEEDEPILPAVSSNQERAERGSELAEPRAELAPKTALPSEDSLAPETAPPASVAADSTAFPVLPSTLNRPAVSEAPLLSAPPPWTTPRPLMTPGPRTLGPLAEQPSARRRLRRSLVLFGSLGVLAAAAVLALALPFLFSSPEAARPRVRAVTAAPATVFRYFDGSSVIQAVPGLMLKFPVAGKVIRLASAGSAVAAGDVLAATEVARPLQDKLVRQRERLAYSQQMVEAMHQVGNTKEEEKQSAKVDLRKEGIAKILHALGDVAVVANAPGVVEETFSHEGDTAAAGSPALRLHSVGFRAIFEFPRQQTAQARRLGFCQVESDGDIFDCLQVQEGSDDARTTIEIPAVPASLQGKAAHLARARYEAAFVVPLGAIVHSGNRDEVLLVSPQLRALSRPVTVAERDASEAVVVQGLDAGDSVIVEVAPGLRAGMQVAVFP